MAEIFKPFDRDSGPGCAVLIVKDGKVIFKKGYGMANLEYDAPITPATVFDIASVSKQFTGYAISTLIERGVLSPDDDIHKYLPDVPEFASRITIRNLIHHTSGLRDWPEGLHAAGWRWDESFGWDDIQRMIRLQKDLDFPSGSEYQYSNSGYNLLAAIVAKVSGETFPGWVSEHIFVPLGMHDSRVLTDFGTVIPRLATSYSSSDKGYHKSTDQLTAWGSSSIFTTVEDLARWVIFFQHGLESHDPVILRMIETDTLNNGKRINYAYGLDVEEDNGFRNIQHTGGWASFRTIITNYPDQHLAVIVLGNDGDFNPSLKARAVAALFIKGLASPGGAAGDDVGSRPTISLDSAVLKRYLGTYLLGPHWYATFTLENGQMMVQANGEPKFPAFMKSDTVAWVPAYNASATFLNVTERAQAIRYKGHVSPRVALVDVGHLVLNDYAGEFYSTEFEATYRVSVVSGKLMVHHMRLGDFSLEPDLVNKDTFSGDAGTMQFVRDAQGVVTGFTLSGGRIRNIKFKKL
jgi:CubicO group peptidase (beta-lactamase class C family)